MGLQGIVIPERTIKVGDGNITVRGISFGDLMRLVDAYGPQMAVVFGKLQSGQSLQSSDVKALIGTLATEFPGMVAGVIAAAADSYDPEGIELVSKLPVPVQIEIIENVFELTFTSEADIKKLLGSLTKMLTEVSGALTEAQFRLPTGIGESEEA